MTNIEFIPILILSIIILGIIFQIIFSYSEFKENEKMMKRRGEQKK